MDATCNHCSHWEQEQAKKQVQSDEFGVCNELSNHNLDPEYVLPVINERQLSANANKGFEMITGAMFGCNHFEEKGDE
jgi:hypothetical protein